MNEMNETHSGWVKGLMETLAKTMEELRIMEFKLGVVTDKLEEQKEINKTLQNELNEAGKVKSRLELNAKYCWGVIDTYSAEITMLDGQLREALAQQNRTQNVDKACLDSVHKLADKRLEIIEGLKARLHFSTRDKTILEAELEKTVGEKRSAILRAEAAEKKWVELARANEIITDLKRQISMSVEQVEALHKKHAAEKKWWKESTDYAAHIHKGTLAALEESAEDIKRLRQHNYDLRKELDAAKREATTRGENVASYKASSARYRRILEQLVEKYIANRGTEEQTLRFIGEYGIPLSQHWVDAIEAVEEGKPSRR